MVNSCGANFRTLCLAVLLAFNEYFDTQVDDIVIAKKTLNGKYLLEFAQKEALDELIENNPHLKDRKAEPNLSREMGKSNATN